MAKIKIVTDSTSDLPKDVATELGITVVPLYVHFGEEVFQDGVDISGNEFYRRLTEGPVLPKTSAPSPDTFKQLYNNLAKGADGILSLHIASKLSATYESALVGHNGADCPVSVVDSRSVSMGLGLLAIIAARAANNGATLQEIVELVYAAIPRIRVFTMVGTLEYLRKGGRIGKAQWLLGSLLKVKPIIEISDGQVLGIAKARSHAKAIDKVRKCTESLGDIEEMAIVYNTNPQEAKSLGCSVGHLIPEEKVFYTTFGPVIGTYTGPGAIGIVSLLKDGA
ncbi:DegV family protein [Chloroflexota bacterium]